MENVKTIKSSLIDKILSIDDREFLLELDNIISFNNEGSEIVELSKEQKTMLAMSDDDIKNGRLISQEAMDKRNLQWLSEM